MPVDVGNRPAGLVRLSGRAVKRFLQADDAVLILTRDDCAHCAVALARLEALLDDRALAGAAVGAVVLDRSGARRFRCDNPRLGGLTVFPYLVRYRKGRRVAGIAAAHQPELLMRLIAARRPPARRAA